MQYSLFGIKQQVFFCMVLFSCVAQAQIINTESLRKVTDTSGWSGTIGANFSITKNTNTLIKLHSNAHVQYEMKKHLVLFVNNLSFERAGEQRFVNQGSQHLRYNYRFHNRVAWEFFVQSQYNSIAKIRFRGLVGSGPRFTLSKTEKLRTFFGSLLMYEHEELEEEVLQINRDWRLSSYVSINYYPTERVTLSSTTYYQPRIDAFSDYRISSESALVVSLLEKLSLNITYRLVFDATPATAIPTTLYELTTGVLYSFD